MQRLPVRASVLLSLSSALGLLASPGCSDKLEGPKPSLTGASPALVCVEQLTTAVTLSGSGLAPTVFDALTDKDRVILPQIDLSRQSDLDGNTITSTPVRIPDDEVDAHVRWTDSTSMEFDVFPELGLQPGIYDIEVTNPSGAKTRLSGALGAVERPRIIEIIPEALCLAQGEQSFEIRGSGFLVVAGIAPEVTVGDKTYAGEAGGCADLDVPLSDVQVCSSVVVTIPQDDLAPGSYDVVLTNPQPAACSSSDAAKLEITLPPEITSVDPLVICKGGGTFDVKGMNFRPGATVSIGGQDAASTMFVSAGELTANFGAFTFDTGTYPIVVDNQDGCTDEFSAQITVVPGIVVFFMDPPVLYNGIAIQVTVFVSGLTATPTRVAIRDSTGNEIDLTASVVFPRPGRVQVLIPGGLAPGSYDVIVEDATQCEALLPGAVTVTAQEALALEAIEPPFGDTTVATAVDLRAALMPAAGDVQFSKTPRAYLNPVGGGTASQLESVAFVSPTRLTGTVPAGLPPGRYDVIVVNPSGEVGVLPAGFQVVAEGPPIIDSITPGSLATSNTPPPTTIVGDNFRSPTVELTCLRADGVTTTKPAVVITAVDSTSTPETIDITVATNVLDQGTACAIRVTNSDGTFVDFGVLTITNPQQAANAIHFSADSLLVTPRRAPATTAGRASRTARFLYAIGGDDGTIAGAHASVEAVPVDLLGKLGTWFTLPSALPEGRTLAHAVTVNDRFIYLVGGATQGAPTATTLRAKILDPAEKPRLDDLELTLETTGLDPGFWYYRLAAVMAPGSVKEPGGGETLASDPLVVQIPAFEGSKVQITLLWPAVTGAVEYRLYRTPAANQASGDELLLATIPATMTSFTDDGSATPAGAVPLPLGSTGVWHAIASLNVARQGHGLAVAKDPATPDLFHIYAVAGENTGDLLTAERLSVTVAANGQQNPGSWVAEASLPAGTARRNLEVLVANSASASKVGSNVWIYALGGNQGAGVTGATHAAQVSAGGAITWTQVASMSPARASYGAALANNFLFTLGGTGNDSSGNKANICGAPGDSGCGATPAPPDLGGWTSLSSINMQPRSFMGSAVQSGFLYLIGGMNGNVVSNTTDRSVLGGQP